MMDLEVVVLAAGDGRRMRSALPKVLHEVAGRPLLAWVIEAARALEPAAIHVVYRNEAVRSGLEGALEPGSPPLQWVVQPRPLGTGHAVAQALPAVSDGRAVVVIYGDVPSIDPVSLRRVRSAVGPHRLAILTVELERPEGYGRVRRDSGGRVLGIVEERDASPVERAIREVNTGIVAAPIEALRRWVAALSADNEAGEYYLTDIFAMAVEEGFVVAPVELSNPGEWMGVNDRSRARGGGMPHAPAPGGGADAERGHRARCVADRHSRGGGSRRRRHHRCGSGPRGPGPDRPRERSSGRIPCSATRRSAKVRRSARTA